MTFLPIVERELRVGARRKSTYWGRLVVALAAMIVGSAIFLGNLEVKSQEMGQIIFRGLSGLALLFCLMAGRRSTADCLSEEKREGTLGLLFLTDLNGYDIVLGKLAATSLNSFYGLIAVFPVLAVPLLMGGTGSGEFWRMVLVLLNTFLLSLAAGIFISAISRESRQAMAGNFLLILLLAIFLPGCAGLIAYSSPTREIVRPLLLTSPGYAFALSFESIYRIRPEEFWWSMGIMHGLTWIFVILASRIIPGAWQDQPIKRNESGLRELRQAWSYGNATERVNHRKKLLDINAYFWLAARARLKPVHVWAFLAVLGAGWLVGWIAFGNIWFGSEVKITVAMILNLTIKLWIMSEAGQRLGEDQRTGAMELLLSTPLTVRDILRGQLLALKRQFFAPIIATAVLNVLIVLTLDGVPADRGIQSAMLVLGFVLLLADIFAVTGVVMYFSLTARSLNHATGATLLRLLLLPWVIFAASAIGANIAAGVAGLPQPEANFYLCIWFVPGMALDLLFGVTAWRRLRNRFRQLATQRFTSGQQASGWFARITKTFCAFFL